ncbi:hypothetical protein [uncultured Veillonella sp.]|uniref:hypothetical protein n=1 Tax=uncultured Veillonella sp. TaxID=159268 RepID=UPI0025D5C39F|nr:hypothetical protein [uncultured Veillonella sp.]MDY3974761.1 hypothetical protein [Veillonella caviae]
MKRKFTIFLALCMLALATLVAGCGSSEGDKFIGTWEGPTTESKLIGTSYRAMTIEKLSETQFQITYYHTTDGSKAFHKLPVTSRKEVVTATLNEKDPKVLLKQAGEKIILLENEKIQDTEYDNNQYTKKSDKVLTYNELKPLPDAPEPK